VCCLEVPQLWNDRCFSKIRVRDGSIEPVRSPSMHGLYGGVDFGIDRFRLSAPSRVATSVVAGRSILGRPATSLMAGSRTGLTMGPARQFARLSAPLSTSLSGASLRLPRVAAGLSMGVPQGVDLNLDRFNLSAYRDTGKRWGSVQAKEHVAIGSAFWSSVSSDAPFRPEDRELWSQVFNPSLSDRREDGESFVPPSTEHGHLQRLRSLVKAEQAVLQQRKDHFFSRAFVVDSAGPLFPSSWTSSFEISNEQTSRKVALSQSGGAWHPRPEYLEEEQVLRSGIEGKPPTFDKRTEDGARFRMYRLGLLEVHTVQEFGGEEVIGMVFSLHSSGDLEAVAPEGEGQCLGVCDDDRIVKATEYVERSQLSAGSSSFVVLETDKGGAILVEQPGTGDIAWYENPITLEDRIALAKVIRSKECCDVALSFAELRGRGTSERCKRCVQSVYCHAIGESYSSGFRPAAVIWPVSAKSSLPRRLLH